MGFALETNNAEEHAKGKLERKNLDFIVVNTLEDEGAGFGVDTNCIKIMDKNNNLTSFELKSKCEVARDIVQYLKETI
jgi:phosphopantothenoylcysteine decarboxylase/phosphopantothenate--cysteine ligase